MQSTEEAHPGEPVDSLKNEAEHYLCGCAQCREALIQLNKPEVINENIAMFCVRIKS